MIHLLETISALPPFVQMLLIMCIFFLVLFQLSIIVFCPEGMRRLIELIQTLQRRDSLRRRYTKRQQGRK
jgi:hypothetical protein